MARVTGDHLVCPSIEALARGALLMIRLERIALPGLLLAATLAGAALAIDGPGPGMIRTSATDSTPAITKPVHDRAPSVSQPPRPPFEPGLIIRDDGQGHLVGQGELVTEGWAELTNRLPEMGDEPVSIRWLAPLGARVRRGDLVAELEAPGLRRQLADLRAARDLLLEHKVARDAVAAQVRWLGSQLLQTQLVAPFDGIVAQPIRAGSEGRSRGPFLRVGSQLAEGQAVASVCPVLSAVVLANPPEADRILPGQPVRLDFLETLEPDGSGGMVPLRGVVESVVAQDEKRPFHPAGIDPGGLPRRVNIRLVIEPDTERLQPAMPFYITIPSAKGQPTPAAP
jgi:hypothetical protein